MRQIQSKQRNVEFFFCPSPCTIDKSSEWGPGNHQVAPNGAFMKINEGDAKTISHLVQPNNDKTAPIGWVKTGFNSFDKAPIWVAESALIVGETVHIDTLDGPINYEVKEEAYICANDLDGEPNPVDQWAQTRTNLDKNYEF
jgi:hypothetical protein